METSILPRSPAGGQEALISKLLVRRGPSVEEESEGAFRQRKKLLRLNSPMHRSLNKNKNRNRQGRA